MDPDPIFVRDGHVITSAGVTAGMDRALALVEEGLGREIALESARIALETGGVPVEAVARRSGFGTVETMRRAFRRRLGVSPASYRERFRSAA